MVNIELNITPAQAEKATKYAQEDGFADLSDFLSDIVRVYGQNKRMERLMGISEGMFPNGAPSTDS